MKDKSKWLIGGLVVAVLVLLAVAIYVKSTAPTEEDIAKAAAAEAAKVAAAKDAELAKTTDLYSEQIKELQEGLGTLEEELAKKELELEEAKKPVEVVAAPSTPAGEVLDDLYLGDEFAVTLDDGDLPKLIDGEITFDEEKYDVKEEFVIESGKTMVAYSLVDDEEFGAMPYLVLSDEGALRYVYTFEESITASAISDDEPLKIKFLGKDVEIIEATTSKVVFREGTSYTLKEGDTIFFDGKEVTLAFVSENGKASISVDGVVKTIDEYDSETIGGIDVRVEEILVNNRGGLATVVLGDDTVFEQDDGDDYFGNKEFTFEVEIDAGELKSLSVIYDQKRVELDDKYTPLALDSEIVFPNKFITVRFDQLKYADYVGVDVEFEAFDDELKDETQINDKPAVLLSADTDAFEVGTDETSEVYVAFDGKVYFKDSDGEWLEEDISELELVNDKAKYTFSFDGTKLVITDMLGKDLVIDTDFTNEQLGSLDEEAEATDLVFDGQNIGEREYDVLTPYGTIVAKPEAHTENDKVSFLIPSDRVEAEVLVYTTA